ncbi:MAG: restriction endonuclease subunit S [Methyloprofundus sp.]|nr:restriction endonuclease subunit S [Methyloprofundus sp.]
MVPNGWKHSTFDKHIDCLTGFAFKSSEYSENSNDIKLLRGDNISPIGLRWEGVKLWPVEKYDELKTYHLKEGDFVIAMDRTWVSKGLKVAEVKSSDLPCLLVQRVARIRAKKNLEQALLKQYFSGHRFEQYVKSVQTATAVPHISPTDIKEFPFLLPPIPEQKKIAQILSTWDQAITITEQLLANSQQQKKALMQQLLTGKKRLHDQNGQPFTDEWKEKSLEDIFSFKKGKGLSKGMVVESGSNKCVLYGELYTKYSEVISAVISRTESGDGTPSKVGDILIPSSTTTSGVDLANATAILECDVLLGGDINILRPKVSMSSVFMAHVLTHIKKHEIASRAQGITIIHLYGSDLKGLKVQIPPVVEEQQKIAAVLTAADNEIDTLKHKLDHLKQEKKALMQQLLTGKRRVLVN